MIVSRRLVMEYSARTMALFHFSTCAKARAAYSAGSTAAALPIGHADALQWPATHPMRVPSTSRHQGSGKLIEQGSRCEVASQLDVVGAHPSAIGNKIKLRRDLSKYWV
jgi:hypothetical protein